jgi:hypothetical protein
MCGIVRLAGSENGNGNGSCWTTTGDLVVFCCIPSPSTITVL